MIRRTASAYKGARRARTLAGAPYTRRMLAVAWGTVFAAVGGSAAVAVAAFTGLTYRMGRQDFRRLTADRARDEATRTRREAAAHLVAVRMDEARSLALKPERPFQPWDDSTVAFLEAAFGKPEAVRYGAHIPSVDLRTLANRMQLAEGGFLLLARAEALASILERFPTVAVRDDFDADEWSSAES